MKLVRDNEKYNPYFQAVGKMTYSQSRFDILMMVVISHEMKIKLSMLTNVILGAGGKPTTGKLIDFYKAVLKEMYLDSGEKYLRFCQEIHKPIKDALIERNTIIHSLAGMREEEGVVKVKLTNFKKFPVKNTGIYTAEDVMAVEKIFDLAGIKIAGKDYLELDGFDVGFEDE